MNPYEFTAPIEWEQAFSTELVGTKLSSVHVRDPDGWIAAIHHHSQQAKHDVLLLAKENELGRGLPEEEKREIQILYDDLKQETQDLYAVLKAKMATKPIVKEKQQAILLASQELAIFLWTSMADLHDNPVWKKQARQMLRNRTQQINGELRQCSNSKRSCSIESEERPSAKKTYSSQSEEHPSTKRSYSSQSEGSLNAKRHKSDVDAIDVPGIGGSIDIRREMERMRKILDIFETQSQKTVHSDMKPPSMKLPDVYDGSDVSKFRSWWRSVKRYMKVYEATMRRDEIKITWIGSLLRGEALNWYHARETRFEMEDIADDWTSFMDALERRFVDTLEQQKDEKAMRKLRYSGSISNYLAQLDEYNSRVGMTGVTFRNMVIEALPDKIIKMVFARAGEIPQNDEVLLETVKIAGTIVEEHLKITRKKTDASSKTTCATDASGRRTEAEKRKNTTEESDARKKPKIEELWSNITDALKGVPPQEIDEYKKTGGCHRCGRSGHRCCQCYARTTIKGTALPSHPSIQVDPDGNKQNRSHRSVVGAVLASGSEPEVEVSSAIVAGVLRHEDEILDHTRIYDIDSSDNDERYWA